MKIQQRTFHAERTGVQIPCHMNELGKSEEQKGRQGTVCAGKSGMRSKGRQEPHVSDNSVLVFLTYLAQHNVLKVQPCCCKWQDNLSHG